MNVFVYLPLNTPNYVVEQISLHLVRLGLDEGNIIYTKCNL